MRMVAVALPLAFVAVASGQSNWDKTYAINSSPALQVQTDDAPVRVSTCGGCRSVHIHVDPHGADMAHYRITEMQGGNGIHFELRRRAENSFFHFPGPSPQVVVETPAASQLSVQSGSGALAVNGVHGEIELRTGSGSIQTAETTGPLRITTSSGSINVSHIEGALTAHTGSGAMTLEGRLSLVDAQTGSGAVHLAMLPGSRLTASSRVVTGSGSVGVRLPRNLQAELSASSGSGGIANTLPLQMAANDGHHDLHGTLNGGGPLLHVQTGSGAIALGAD